MSTLPLLSSKTSIKFLITFPSAFFPFDDICQISSYPFPSTPHKLGLLFYLHFHTSHLYLPDSKSIFTCPRKHIIFSLRLLCLSFPSLLLHIFNIFWTPHKEITHFHDIVISTYFQVQAYHMLIVQSCASLHLTCFPD